MYISGRLHVYHCSTVIWENKFLMDRELSTSQNFNTANYWRHDGRDVVDVDVADRTQACTLYILYFQAETTILMHVSSNSNTMRYGGCEIEEGIHDGASKSKGQDILSVLPAVTHPVQTAHGAGQHTIYMKTANSAFQHYLICQGHGIQYAYSRSR